MADEKRTDDVGEFLSEQKLLDDRKQPPIYDLLKQRDAAIAAFDEKSAKLSYTSTSSKGNRRHHGKSASRLETPKAAI